MDDSLSIAAHVYCISMLTSLLVKEILLTRYMNWSTNFRCLIFQVDMAPFSSGYGTIFFKTHCDTMGCVRQADDLFVCFGAKPKQRPEL